MTRVGSQALVRAVSGVLDLVDVDSESRDRILSACRGGDARAGWRRVPFALDETNTQKG